MPFNPENPRTEDREFHSEQDNMNIITQELDRIKQAKNLVEFPDESAKETFIRSLDVAEEQIKNIREQIG